MASLCTVYRQIVSKRLFYDWRTRSETIFALASSIQPVKGSPLGIIRISGSRTSQVLQALTRLEPLRLDGQSSDEPSIVGRRQLLPRYATLAKILEPDFKELIDIGLVLWFPKPGSYTGEDTCELHVHGSQAIIKKLMSLLGRFEGVRPAEPGEFTRRAVQNGKLSLMQAESLPELIAAQTDQQRKLALKGLSSTTRRKYDAWIEDLIKILAHLEASIDFGEDEHIGEENVLNECIQSLSRLSDEISKFINITSKCRNLAQSGVKVSILGPPNAGKSTLMNMLCRQEKSIVSDLSGTTRDVIEHPFDLNGHTVTLCDTAGLRDLDQNQSGQTRNSDVIRQHDSIEREGIKRAMRSASQADLLMYIVDCNQLVARSDPGLVEELASMLKTLDVSVRSKVIHLVMNKLDLKPEIEAFNLERVEKMLCDKLDASRLQIATLSCKTEKNIDLLIRRISASLDKMRPSLDGIGTDMELEYANERHLALLASTLKHLERATKLQMRNIDEIAQHVRESVDYLSRVVGSVSNEQVFDIIFRDFCIGK